MKRFLSFLLAIGAAIGAYFAVTLLLWQHKAVREFVPVEARIVSAEVRRHSGKKTTYSPEITYTYRYADHDYTSSQVLPVSENSSYAWAENIVNRFGGPTHDLPGLEVHRSKAIAYVNPDKPEEAILVREYSFMPYIFTLLTGLASLLGLGLFTGVVGGGRDRMTAIALDETDTRLLLPAKSLYAASRDAILWTAGAAVVALPLLAHWAFAAGRSSLVFGLIVLVGLGVLGVIAYRRWSLTRSLSDARVRVRPAPLVRGQPFAVEVEADVRAPLRITAARVRVRCIEYYKEKRGNKTSYGSRTRGEEVAPLLTTPAEFASGAVFTGAGELVLCDLPPTTDRTLKTYPYYRWELRLEIEIEKHANYRAAFPLDAV
jgi:hypothetical protein